MTGESESHPPIYTRLRLRSVLLAGLTVLALLMLWWMYAEQGQIEKYSQLSRPTGQVQTPIQVQVQNLCPNQSKTANTAEIKDTQRELWDYNWDKRQWPVASDAQGVGVRTVLLVRHGKYDLSTGHLDSTGRAQANMTGARLAGMGVEFVRLVHSSMARARETAELIRPHLAGVRVEEDSLLIEGGPVKPLPTLSYWSLPDKDYFVDGPRLEAAFRKYFHRADKSQRKQTFELIVAHGNICRYFVLRALQLSATAWMRMFLAHASITLLHINPDGTVTLSKLGDSGHFPYHMISY